MFDAAPTAKHFDLGAEMAVLGGVLLENERMAGCAALHERDFYNGHNRVVWGAMQALHAGGTPIDTVVLRSYLLERNALGRAGGDEHLLDLTSVVPRVENIAEHVAIIRRKATQRQASALARAASTTDDVDAAQRDLSAARELLSQMNDGGIADEWLTLGHRGRWLEEAPPPREWLLKRGDQPVLGRGDVGMFVAPGGRGKSYALCDLAISIATGTPWLGAIDVACPGRVVLALAEETAEEVRRRLYAVAVARRMTTEEVELAYERIVPLGLRGRVVSLARIDGGTVTPSGVHTEMLRLLSAREYVAVLLDPMSRWAGGVESDNDLATRGIQLFEQLAAAARGTVIVAHHTAKWSRKDGAGDHGSSARGVTAITDGARWQAELQGKDETDLVLAVTKSNGAPPCEPIRLVREPSGAIRAMTPAEIAATDKGEEPAQNLNQDAARLVYALRTSVEPIMNMTALRELSKGGTYKRMAAIKHARANGWIDQDARGQYFVTDQAPTGRDTDRGEEFGG